MAQMPLAALLAAAVALGVSFQIFTIYELQSWEAITASGDCGCDIRFPSWDAASAEYEERFATSTQAEHTQAQLALRNEQNQIAPDIQDICETQGNW